jgi:hypothetical protein
MNKKKWNPPIWETRPISPTCEHWHGTEHRACGVPTSYAYPAMGGGWMALCEEHAQRFLPPGPRVTGCEHVDELIARGETWA